MNEESFKDWIRNQKCVACLSFPPNDPHHLESGKMGGKKSSLTCIPLCRECHRYYHDHGHDALEEKERVDLWRQAHRLLRQYLDDHAKLI